MKSVKHDTLLLTNILVTSITIGKDNCDAIKRILSREYYLNKNYHCNPDFH